MVPLLAWRAVSEHSAYESCDRLHGWLHRTFCVRRVCGAPADLASGVRSRCIRSIQDHLRKPGADGAEKPGARVKGELRPIAVEQAVRVEQVDRHQQVADKSTSEFVVEPKIAAASTQGVWRRTANDHRRWRFYGTVNAAVFL